jgi:hypothetical protein
MTIKVCSTPSFGWEVKPEAPCHMILWQVKEPCVARVICYVSKMRPVLIQWNVCPAFMNVLFSRKYHSVSSVLAQGPYEECIIISNASYLEVLFSLISHSEFLVLTHSIHGMMISEKNSESKLVFLECTVALICPHCCFWENVMKSHDAFGMYSSGNLSIL